MFGFGRKKEEVKEEIKPISNTVISLEKRVETFTISLSKNAPTLMDGKFAVEIAMDKSGSFSDEIEGGLVQEILNRLIPIGMKFDDNKSMGFHYFNTRLFEMEDVTLSNYQNFIKNTKDKVSYGGTSYAPFVEKMINKYKGVATIEKPVLCLFFTDGDCGDNREMTRVMQESAKYPIFFKFIGLGNSDFDYLEKLDEAKGSPVDNADFKAITNIKNMTDSDLYNNLLDELERWFKDYKKIFG